MPRRPRAIEPKRRPYGGWGIDFRPERKRSPWRVRPPASLRAGRGATYHATRADAEAYIAGQLDLLSRPAAPDAAMSLEEWLKRWLRIAGDSSGWSNSTRLAYLTQVRYLTPYFDLPLTAITRAVLQERIAELTQAGIRKFGTGDGAKTTRPLSAHTIRDAVSTWRRAFADAIEDDHLTKNPARNLRVPRVEPAEADTWSATEARRLVTVTRTHRFGVVVALVVGCAMRIGEVLGLRWDDIDYPTRTVMIRRSGTRKLISEHTKSRRVRTLALPPPVWAALLRHRERQHDGAAFVMERAPGRRWTYHTMRRVLHEMTAEAGIPPYAWHAGRHAAATFLLASDVSEAEVARLLGHANPSVTQAVYHHSVRDSGQVAEIAAQLFDGPENGE
jgi:integrase